MISQHVFNLTGPAPYGVAVGKLLTPVSDANVSMIKVESEDGELVILLSEENFDKFVDLLVRAKGLREQHNGPAALPDNSSEVGH